VPELPRGPARRRPHGVNDIHGTSHYNSGVFLFTDFADAIEYRRKLGPADEPIARF
jgi:hypothetical protein